MTTINIAVLRLVIFGWPFLNLIFTIVEVIWALINSFLVLMGGSAFVINEAIKRVREPEHSDARGMMFFAIVGIIVNGIAAYKLRGGKILKPYQFEHYTIETELPDEYCALE